MMLSQQDWKGSYSYYRVHRGKGDCGQNEDKHTNCALGEAIVDGLTIDWKHFKYVEGMADEQRERLQIKQFDQLEKAYQ